MKESDGRRLNERGGAIGGGSQIELEGPATVLSQRIVHFKVTNISVDQALEQFMNS